MTKEEKKIRKAEKKAYKKALKKAVRPWRGLRRLTGFLAAVVILGGVFADLFDNSLAAFTGGSFHKLVNEDKDAVYFSLDFDSVEELAEYGLAVCKQVEAEGAALLLNNAGALPLSRGNKVSLFSGSSVNLVYGGTGSGNIDASTADNLLSALTKTGIEVNPVLWDFYTQGPGKKYVRGGGTGVSLSAATVNEVPWSVYTDEVLSSVEEYSDAAVVVISRVGGEGADLTFDTYNYLELDRNEREMLSALAEMKRQGKVSKTVMLINSANPLQVDFLKGNIYDIDAVLWIGDVGISGINAVAEILSGDINPSGSLADTYCYDNYSAPVMANFVPVTYEGDTSLIPSSADTYMIYQEGIYVGYKYYETRYEDMVMGTGNTEGYDYSKDVAFPFGYGLSYTQFEFSGLSVTYDEENDCFLVKVTVTNEGDVAGKCTTQVYVQSPYTQYDIDNKVEKAAVALCGFAKTDIIGAGASQELSITVDRADIASYDAYGAGTYILDAGDYHLTVARDAHEAVNNILSKKGYSVSDGMDNEGDAGMVYTFTIAEFDDKTYSVSKAGAQVYNRLSDADPNLWEDGKQSVTFVSRSDWKGTCPGGVKLALTDKLIEALQEVTYDPSKFEDAEMPVLGAKGDLTLLDMRGLAYDDPMWEKLLDQLTFKEMVSLIGDSFHFTMPVLSVNAPGTRDENGPQGLTATLFGGIDIESTAFTSEDVMAATFNTDLMYEVGRVIGNDCVAAQITVLYGPGNNIHRSPFGGRNFEYYSEDGFLSGKISASEVKGIQDKGAHVAMKHFALNDCEQDRLGLGVWITEQAAREIYLKAYQDPFEEGNAGGVMTAYTRWGATWSGSNPGLMSGIMREEWGSQGLTITDNILVKYCNGVDALMAGGVSTFDAMLWYVVNQLPKYKNDPIVVRAMREACHHDLYAIVNSLAMNGMGKDTVVKKTKLPVTIALKIAEPVIILLYALCFYMFLRKKKAFKEAQKNSDGE